MVRLSEDDKNSIIQSIRDTIAADNLKREANQGKIISAAVSAAVAPLLKEIEALRDSNEQINDKLIAMNDKLIEKNAKISLLENELKATNARTAQLTVLMAESADANETYGRKDCLRISGIPIQPAETNDSLKASFIEVMAVNGVVVSESDIFRMHRAGRPSPINNFYKYINNVNHAPVEIDPNNMTQTAEIIVRFTNWGTRARVYDLHYKKNIHIRVRCDLTKFRQGLLATARNYLKDNELKGYTYNNAECSLVIKDAESGNRMYYKSLAEFKTFAAGLGRDPAFNKRNQQQPDAPRAVPHA